jgi:protein prenyltransferase alpha subunit repeat containing protein 1
LENGHANGSGNEEALLQKNLMLYTRVLVIVNSDFASAWNARKRILSRVEATEASLLAELRLAGMVLAYGPKSEESWAYRRWIINRMIAGGIQSRTLDEVLKGDSMLVEAIAGRSTMNYRAWRHRYWLVSRMTLKQASLELQDTKRWAQSHVADNCCFHYRRCLLLGLLQAGLPPNGKTVSGPTLADSTAQANLSSALSTNPQFLTTLWKEEFSWNKDLIERYIGREALWLHRRFLIWAYNHYSKIFGATPSSGKAKNGGSTITDRGAMLAERELGFADACIAACQEDPLDDACRQQEYAAAYKLWVLRLRVGGKDDGKKNGHITSRELEFNNLELVLKEVSPHRECLWNGLVPNVA